MNRALFPPPRHTELLQVTSGFTSFGRSDSEAPCLSTVTHFFLTLLKVAGSGARAARMMLDMSRGCTAMSYGYAEWEVLIPRFIVVALAVPINCDGIQLWCRS